jgi:hypothetical protein
MSLRYTFVAAILAILVLGAGCSERDPADLEVARARIDPVVFDDAYSDDVYFQPFSGTFTFAAKIDSVYASSGLRSLKVTVPPDGSPLGAYAGGVLTSVSNRDETDFNALVFYARSSVASTLNEAGFGNDNTGTSLYKAGRSNIPLTTDWTRVVVPIPRSSRLIAERGLFTFAEGFENPDGPGHEVWFDEIRFAEIKGIENPRPRLPSATKQYFIGSTASLAGTFTVFEVDGSFVVVNHDPGYFDFQSSDPSVAKVSRGEVRIVGTGTATITATMDTLDVVGSLNLTGYPPPATAAPAPTLPAGDVISMFSDVYQDVPVTSFNPHWAGSTTEDADYVVAGSNTKMYSNLNFVGIDFVSQTIDASAMTHLHLDVYAPAGSNFRVKIVAFDGDNGAALGESELTFDGSTTPAFVAGDWSSLDIPLADFALAAPLDHVGQIVLSTSDARLVLVDNIYWHR